MCELGDEELSFRKPEAREEVNNTFRDIGWYTDSRGYKHYGVKPTEFEEEYETPRPRAEDAWLYKELL